MIASKIAVHVVSPGASMLEALLTIGAHNALMYGSARRVTFVCCSLQSQHHVNQALLSCVSFGMLQLFANCS